MRALYCCIKIRNRAKQARDVSKNGIIYTKARAFAASFDCLRILDYLNYSNLCTENSR